MGDSANKHAQELVEAHAKIEQLHAKAVPANQAHKAAHAKHVAEAGSNHDKVQDPISSEREARE
eukprot:12485610-Heterocapsa_arctica.AAC.1